MREILYKGKRVDNGEWVYGLPYKAKYGCISSIVNDDEERFLIFPETVGQFTGLTDKNGKKIFEGDIVWGDTIEGDWHKGVVEYNEDMGWYFVNAKSFMQYEKNSDSWSMLGMWTIEGNIHDNKELLEVDNV